MEVPGVMDEEMDALLIPTMDLDIDSFLGDYRGYPPNQGPLDLDMPKMDLARLEEADCILPSWDQLLPESNRCALNRHQEWQVLCFATCACVVGRIIRDSEKSETSFKE